MYVLPQRDYLTEGVVIVVVVVVVVDDAVTVTKFSKPSIGI